MSETQYEEPIEEATTVTEDAPATEEVSITGESPIGETSEEPTTAIQVGSDESDLLDPEEGDAA